MELVEDILLVRWHGSTLCAR